MISILNLKVYIFKLKNKNNNQLFSHQMDIKY